MNGFFCVAADKGVLMGFTTMSRGQDVKNYEEVGLTNRQSTRLKINLREWYVVPVKVWQYTVRRCISQNVIEDNTNTQRTHQGQDYQLRTMSDLVWINPEY